MTKAGPFKKHVWIGKIFLFMLCVFRGFLSAQVTDTAELAGVTIVSPRNNILTPGSKTTEFDSLTLLYFNQNSVAELLQQQSQVFVKTYGAGSLATTSFRGGAATQTAVLWNGFNLNTPNYGQFDLAFIPVSFVNKVEVNYGGSSALWGSGAIGGTLQLRSDARFNSGFKINAGAGVGSFRNFRQDIAVEFSRKKFIASIKYFRVDNENAFSFHNPSLPGNPVEQMSYANVWQQGILSENYFRINARQKINFRIWYQLNKYWDWPVYILRFFSESYERNAVWQVF